VKYQQVKKQNDRLQFAISHQVVSRFLSSEHDFHLMLGKIDLTQNECNRSLVYQYQIKNHTELTPNCHK
jgi:hypothetical protein